MLATATLLRTVLESPLPLGIERQLYDHAVNDGSLTARASGDCRGDADVSDPGSTSTAHRGDTPSDAASAGGSGRLGSSSHRSQSDRSRGADASGTRSEANHFSDFGDCTQRVPVSGAAERWLDRALELASAAPPRTLTLNDTQPEPYALILLGP